MTKYFLSNPAAPNNCWPMVFSAFSHYSLFHLAANMFVLHSFSTSMVTLLGKEQVCLYLSIPFTNLFSLIYNFDFQFVALYCSSAVFSSFCSHVFKVLSGRNAMSLGASGAICAVLVRLSFLPIGSFFAENPSRKVKFITNLISGCFWYTCAQCNA